MNFISLFLFTMNFGISKKVGKLTRFYEDFFKSLKKYEKLK